MDKILFTGGSSLVLPGVWQSGDPFDGDSSVSAVVRFKGGSRSDYTCTVTPIVGSRDFEIYASAQATSDWPRGEHLLFISRTEPNYFPNGDAFVETLEPFKFEVK